MQRIMEEESHIVSAGNTGEEARCNLLIAELFHIEMELLEDGCGHLILLAFRAVAAL